MVECAKFTYCEKSETVAAAVLDSENVIPGADYGQQLQDQPTCSQER